MAPADSSVPGAGQLDDAQKLLAAWVKAWGQMGGLPELFDMAAKERHPLQKVSCFSFELRFRVWISHTELFCRLDRI